MKITRIETIWFEAVPQSEWAKLNPKARQALPNNLWVRIYTDNGLVGLGETYYLPRAVAPIIHDIFAPLLIGRDPRDIENHWSNMFALVNFCGAYGAEMRAISAVDVALWDIAGQNAGEPIYTMLGGRSRDRIAIYNTCVGYGKYDDLNAWLTGKAGELAENLVAQGITAMKIWPFDQFGPTLSGPVDSRKPMVIWGAQTAAGPRGHSLSHDELKAGIAIVEDIRRAVGDRMQIAIEGHARWDLGVSTKIARALEPLDIMWLEEIMPPDNVDSYVRLKQETTIPICQSERVFTRYGFRPWIEKGAADIIMPDLSWGGGLTEGRKIASMADTYFLPVTCHDTIGPVALWAATHLMHHIPNALIMETVRGYIDGWYDDVVTDRIEVRDGHLHLPDRPGLGTKLRDDIVDRPNARIEITTEDTLKRW
ncbi:mandelate racemase/muconate lactonizing enzyme family protein [Kaistia dalseonensis]|uniref:L-alanine-DL-glutamate epimerase-like enolase superfamily enzyme n=1 Tax=Kaistia dalseonensis TaxID=410840 RepID=A0ABU0H3K4_9HYPH|nr:mandelate racemase/muconate lactonizing enzyme family protein [Kaistia dalseonensis]MCX5494054.1 mandelate racemase/muconate lactonizing enzyme family protein [Kaistia dalseonensis]MDQ0436632.1 L-alanine-DL-glutamate epimerase-like enolase superfamily enzyme [Kaistia dalseonensis]